MPVLGITGGIATGKSTLTRALRERLAASVFDADAAARALLQEDAGIVAAVKSSFGADIYHPDATLDRDRLRSLIFAAPERRAALEAILHPVVRRRWLAAAETARQSGEWLLVDIPLLYETKAEVHLDRVIVVGCSASTQRRRLLTNRALPLEMAERIIAAQLDLRTKIQKADHLIWNDSTPDCLAAQADLLINWLTRTYGRTFQS